MVQLVAHLARQRITERTSINLIFLLAGLSFATWAGRLSIIDTVFDFSGLSLGSFLICSTVGTLLGISLIPTISKFVPTRRLLCCLPIGLAACLVMLGIAISITANASLAYIALFLYGITFGCLDIMMNVSGAQVERRVGRSIMPSLHGFFSLGTLLGAGLATATISMHIPSVWHFSLVSVLIAILAYIAHRGVTCWENENFVPSNQDARQGPAQATRKNWLLLLLGVMVAGLSFTEGAANDWIAVTSVDGHGFEHGIGALMFTLFVAAMTLGRFVGGRLVDRLGTKNTLLIMGLIGLLGVALFITGTNPYLVGLGSMMWGLGSSLGFPLGMSIAASRGERLGPKAVSIVSAFGYGAMLGGPPFIGFVVDTLKLPQALWICAIVLITSLLLTPAVTRIGKPADKNS
ncbi:MFS transporter [Glutamicibacter sp. PAEs-4]|uniref:MFS transporter n=1 Tax=Glutamicibacter sp. PAEs-4 TaxID=3444114 RepID=UPI003EB9B6C3